mmetsp:Transcript_9491/g.14224  ORF Transcript_9491/g.14224 Transcript_9491/m.14224 type:complete len:201 (-) Transcript_9491:234-836(-)
MYCLAAKASLVYLLKSLYFFRTGYFPALAIFPKALEYTNSASRSSDSLMASFNATILVKSSVCKAHLRFWRSCSVSDRRLLRSAGPWTKRANSSCIFKNRSSRAGESRFSSSMVFSQESHHDGFAMTVSTSTSTSISSSLLFLLLLLLLLFPSSLFAEFEFEFDDENSCLSLLLLLASISLLLYRIDVVRTVRKVVAGVL